MIDTLGNALIPYYELLKLFHLLGVFSWMAGLFYLPRLFVYWRETPDSATQATLEIMSRRLYRFIMTPAMHVSVTCGLLLYVLPHNAHAKWLHAKITCVLLLIVFHFVLKSFLEKLSLGVCSQTGKFFRIINEVPTLLLILILYFIVYKPF